MNNKAERWINVRGENGELICDYGNEPAICAIDRVSQNNACFRRALWTGKYLQTTLMTIPVGCDIGKEVHQCTDQMIKIEQGVAMVQFGDCSDSLKNVRRVNASYAIFIPAGTWHNIINCSNVPLKLFSVYAPPQHPFGTLENCKTD